MNIYRDETVALVEKHTAMMKYNVILLKRRKKTLDMEWIFDVIKYPSHHRNVPT